MELCSNQKSNKVLDLQFNKFIQSVIILEFQCWKLNKLIKNKM